jgi:Zn-dependent M16 (insulinase) family peptidase
MALTALLVSEQRLKQWTSLDENVRLSDLTPHIIQAQDLYIQDTLGTLMYNRIKQGIIDNDLNADETTLLADYIAPTLMQYALYLLLPHLKYKFAEKGILNGTSEETSATSLDELKYLRQETLNTAEFYNKRLREYFIDNPSMFPQYQNPGTDGMYPNKQNPYFSGLVTPRRQPTNYYDEICPDCDDCGNCY